MHRFEQCYKRTRRQLKNLKFADSVDLAKVFDAEGPNRQHIGAINDLRTKVEAGKKGGAVSEGQILVDGCADSKGRNLVGMVSNAFSEVNDRVAAVKMARHMYLMKMRGGQDVWVYSPPVDYTEWLYDEYKGLDKVGLATWASRANETYSDADKQAMADATQLAMRWSMKCISELGNDNAATNAVIKRWFCEADASDKDIRRVAKKLMSGFRKIVNVLNSNMLVLSDEPLDRNSGGWKDYAFVYQTEKMNVIYIQQATLSAALGSKMWDAALTIVHELSHRELRTDDHRYADAGPISPGTKLGLTAKQAITNADNWGFFAADLNNAISSGVRTTASGVAA